MDTLNIRFFGIPSITLENKRIDFRYLKAECIFYLLLFEKEASRDVLSSLMWGNMDDITAKKNLRNAIYTIRKQTFDDIIISPKRAVLELNSDYEIVSDVDFINNFDPCNDVESKDIEEFVNCCQGDFLEELKLKSDLEFVEWIDIINTRLKSLYINKLKTLSNKLIKNKDYYYAEMCCRKLIELEEYDETGYTDLMIIFSEQNKHREAIDIYNTLAEKLFNDLSVKTSRETDEVYEMVIKNLKSKSESKTIGFFGRDAEKRKLQDNIFRFIGNKQFKSFIVNGEDGIGKSLLLNEIVKELDLNILFIKISCYEYETDFIFKFWDKVFQQISCILKEKKFDIPNNLLNIINKLFPTLDIDFKEELGYYGFKNPDISEKAIFDLFSLLSNKLKIIFIVDDLNNADKASLELLYKTILANRFNIMLIATTREESGKIDDKLYNLLKFNNIIESIHLKRFNKKETEDFVNTIMPDAVCHIDYIYSESEGNPLFITEILSNIRNGNTDTNISNKIDILIQGRLLNLSNEANKLLSLCSLFQDIFLVDMLTRITDMKGIELIDLIDELLTKEILREETYINGKLGLTFTHRKIREHIYKNISNSKRIILHSKIAEYYEDELLRNNKINRTLYPEMIYHFSSSINKCKYFKYKIRWLEEILNFKHEIFPVAEAANTAGLIEYYLDENSLEKEFLSLKEIYDDLNCDICKNCIEEEILYLYLYGRFNKNIGNAKDGLNLLNKAICLSEENEYYEHAYNGYLQLVHYYVNISNAKSMGRSIERAEELANLLADDCKLAVVWRLKGYFNILSGEYDKGEMFINKALDIFNLPENKDKYILNIVASLFYIGEKDRLQKAYDTALKHYEQSLELCDYNEDCPAAALIFSRIGYVKFHQGIISEAQFYFLKSLKAYENSVFAWGRVDVYYYLYKIYISKNMVVMAKNYLEKASVYANKYACDELREHINSILIKLN
ncbi:AAA family ATPase [Sedimentibacter sp.]|uniref:AAA family ATPase n=1 Tax=Sedimentibacter sp. TaxID=1960295 RepID=UPI00289C9318|nr:AAA family ATPase [Sedimentibacter sp.]